LASGLNISGLFQLPASIQRSVLYCCVSMIKLDRDHGKVCGSLCYQQLVHVVTDLWLTWLCSHGITWAPLSIKAHMVCGPVDVWATDNKQMPIVGFDPGICHTW